MTTTVWADGWGRWHVTLPDTPRAYNKAVEALATEVFERTSHNQSLQLIRDGITRTIVSRPTNEPGLLEFIEYGMDADLN